MLSALPLPARLTDGDGDVTLRRAGGEDLRVLVGLLSDDRVSAAHRFYERLGFVGSHRGFKRRVG